MVDWNDLDKKIQKSERYKFFKKYERILIFIQGFIVIGLLVGIILFFFQDLEIKDQIRERCGYTSNTYECICDAQYVANWKDIKNLKLNLTLEDV